MLEVLEKLGRSLRAACTTDKADSQWCCASTAAALARAAASRGLGCRGLSTTATGAAAPLLRLPCLPLLLLLAATELPCRRLGTPTAAGAPELRCRAVLLEAPL